MSKREMKSEERNYQVRYIGRNFHQSKYLVTLSKDEKRIENSLPDTSNLKMVYVYDEEIEEMAWSIDMDHLYSLVNKEEKEILMGSFYYVGVIVYQEVFEVFERIFFSNKKFFKYFIEKGSSKNYETWVITQFEDFESFEAQIILDFLDEKFRIEDFWFSQSPNGISGVTIKLHESEKARFLQDMRSMSISNEGEISINANDFQGIVNGINRRKKIAKALNK